MANLENRDPTDINNHLKVRFGDTLAEPTGAHSLDCTWQLSYRCFTGGLLCCYRFATIFTSCFYSLCWGWWFGITSFFHVWLCTPFLRGYNINVAFCQRLYGVCYECCQEPCCHACAYCLSHIRVDMLKHYLGPPPKSPQQPKKAFEDTHDDFE